MKLVRLLTLANLLLASLFVALAVTSCRAHAAGLQPLPDSITFADADKSVDVMVSRAKAEQKTCYILVGARWCVSCHQVERAYWPELQRRGYWLRLDADLHPRPVMRVAAISGHAVTALPTLVVVDAGRVVRVLVGRGQIQAYVLEKH